MIMGKAFHVFRIGTILFTIFSSANITAQNDDCIMCHSDQELTFERNGKEISLFISEDKFSKSIHGELDCIDCHNDFVADDLPHKEGENIYQVDCSTCHDNYNAYKNNDIHFRMGVKGAPSCYTCHGTHYISSVSSIKNKSKQFCGKCHDNKTISGKYHQEEVFSDASCGECHDDVETTQEHLELSVHSDFACTDCHSFVADNMETHPEQPELARSASCANCHSDVAKIHNESIHGISLLQGISDAATCSDCHGSHKILSSDNEESKTYPLNIAATCATCHDDPDFENKYQMGIKKPGSLYKTSVHGKALADGDTSAANCITCHGYHNIKNRVQEGSTISSFNIPDMCGECHGDITEEYKKSIHWMYAARGVRDAPVCNDCHSEHSIKHISSGLSPFEKQKFQEETCIRCHQDPMIVEKYGSGINVADNYQDSYHGLAFLNGDSESAKCIDCHTVHTILPASHPESSVSKENVTQTCKKCHEDATQIFSQSYSHVTSDVQAKQIEGIVTNIYFWMIITVIGGMILHNLLIVVFEIRKRRKSQAKAIKIPRFTKNETIQHYLLLSSFIILAITGFALKYPNSWWAEGLYSLGMSETIRQYTHRVSAVIMMVLGLYHIVYLFATKRGRDVLRHLVPNLNDLRDAVDTILYYLRIVKKKPLNDKYDYTEKAEYWALIWGTLVMGITGLFLWFPTLVGDWAPVWWIKVSEIIHFYEAILATLAILVWHWFFVIFHPGEYPMSLTWIDGKMSLSKYRHHHELHFRSIIREWYLMKNGKLDKKNISHSAQLFLDTFKENKLDADEVFDNELKNDAELRDWLKKESEKETKQK